MRVITPFHVVLAVVLVSGHASALESRPTTLSRDGEILAEDPWSAASSCSISYYNVCTGWHWIWSDFEPESMIGLCWDRNCQTVLSVSMLAYEGSPAGYGYTSTVHLDGLAEDCQTTLCRVSSQAFLPVPGWNTIVFPPNCFCFAPLCCDPPKVAIRVEFSGVVNPQEAWLTDAPEGPTGPPACGNCYPTGRVGHSFLWGPPSDPGIEPFDGGWECDAELVWGVTQMGHCGPVSVDGESWGSVKALYR